MKYNLKYIGFSNFLALEDKFVLSDTFRKI